MEIIRKAAQNLKRIRYHQKVNDSSKLSADVKAFFEVVAAYKPYRNEERWAFQLRNVADNLAKEYPDRLRPSSEHLPAILEQIINVYQYLQYDAQGQVGTQIFIVDPHDLNQIHQKAAEATKKLQMKGKKVILTNVGMNPVTKQPSLIINYVSAEAANL